MKMERLSQDKVRIFLTFDDLSERGIEKEDMWREIPKVHELFSEMMEQAYSELGFDASGPLAVEVFALPSQGMVVIVTRGKMNSLHDVEDDEAHSEEELYEMEVTLEDSDIISFAFKDFEDIIQAAKILHTLPLEGGSLFSYKDNWVFHMDSTDMEERTVETIVAILSEFGSAVSITRAVLDEYAKIVMDENAIETLCAHFK